MGYNLVELNYEDLMIENNNRLLEYSPFNETTMEKNYNEENDHATTKDENDNNSIINTHALVHFVTLTIIHA